MCPGQYPTEHSHLITSSHWVERPPPEVSVTSFRNPSLDFTAPDIFRQRPPFAASHSVPLPSQETLSKRRLRGHDSNTDSLHLNAKQIAKERRRVSDPLHDRRRLVSQRDDSIIKNSQRGNQRLLANTSIQQHPSCPPPTSRPISPSWAGSVPVCDDPYTDPEESSDDTLRQTFAAPASPRAVHAKLLSIVRKKLTAQDKCGVIYILRDPARPHLGIKIGCTTQANYYKRMDEHRQVCKFEPEVLYVSTQEVEYCKRTEFLVHNDLADHLQRWPCNRHFPLRMHEEWFGVTEAQAIDTVKRWEDFMRQRPYNWNRELGPIWRYLLSNRISEQLGHSGLTHDVRRQEWTAILSSPTYLEYLLFSIDLLDRTRRSIMMVSLQICAFWKAYGWHVAWIVKGMFLLSTLQNMPSIGTFGVVVVCVCSSIQPQSLGIPKQTRSRRI
jgi:hypothetical protein